MGALAKEGVLTGAFFLNEFSLFSLNLSRLTLRNAPQNEYATEISRNLVQQSRGLNYQSIPAQLVRRMLIHDTGLSTFHGEYYMNKNDKDDAELLSELDKLRRKNTELENTLFEARREADSLRESEYKYRHLFESGACATFLADEETGSILHANAAAMSLYGYSPDELNAMRIFDLSVKSDKSEDGTAFQEVDSILYHRKKNGVVFPVEIKINSLNLNKRHVRIAVIRDCTECVQAEILFREALAKYETVIGNTPFVAIQSFNREGIVQYWNSASESLYGYNSSEALGNRIQDILMTPEESLDFETSLEDIWSRRVPAITREWIVHNRSGESRHIYTTMFPVLFDQEVLEVFRMDVDFTERTRIEESFRTNEARFRTIADLVSDGIYIADSTGKLLEVNEAACQQTGYTRDELPGKNIDDFVPPEFIGWSNLADKDSGYQESGLVRNDGTMIPVELSVHEFDDQELSTLLAIVRDTTERKRIRQELQTIREQLAQSQKMESIGRLAGGMAHDFNNILTVIMGNAELLIFSVSPEDPIYQPLVDIRNSSERASNLTRRLLAFSRKQIVAPRVINLNNTILEMDKMFRRLIGENIELITIPDSMLWQVKADPGQIEQVLTNLVINAGDAMPDGGKIIIETTNSIIDREFVKTHQNVTPGEYVTLTVTDTGVGMDDTILPHIFEPFFTVKPMGIGSGLGLSTCYGIITQNKGTIHVSSEPGKGSSFTVYLPAFTQDQDTLPCDMEPTAPSFTGNETILVVEDDAIIRNMIVRFLRDKGYIVMEAGNGDEALGLLSNYSGTLNLLITDVIMPLMGGKELSESMRSLFPDVKILFVSGYTDGSIDHLGVLDDGIEFMQKPFSSVSLVKKVRGILDA